MRLMKPSATIESPFRRNDLLSLIEKAGRTCYKSEDKITEDSASRFLDSIMKKGHLSVIEHFSVTVRFVIDRGVSHELVRHRLCAFSQESTRYCNYKGGVAFIIPPWVSLMPGEYTEHDLSSVTGMSHQWVLAMIWAEHFYKLLIDNKWSPQQARSVLPNSLKTEIVTTANLREWKHIFSLRCSKAAHPQMQEVMLPLEALFQLQVPEIFGESN